jgi:hypothetical protein
MKVQFFKHRDNVASGELRVKFIGTDENVSDFFTKALLRGKFLEHRAMAMNEAKMAVVEL